MTNLSCVLGSNVQVVSFIALLFVNVRVKYVRRVICCIYLLCE